MSGDLCAFTIRTIEFTEKLARRIETAHIFIESSRIVSVLDETKRNAIVSSEKKSKR